MKQSIPDCIAALTAQPKTQQLEATMILSPSWILKVSQLFRAQWGQFVSDQ